MAKVTWDTVNKGTGVTLSNGNLTASGITSVKSVRASLGKISGKWYWEIKVDAVGYSMIGIVNSLASLTATHISTTNYRYYYLDGNKYPVNSLYGVSYVTGDTIGIALDLDVGAITFYKNGVSQGIAFSDVISMGEVFPAVSSGSSSGSVNVTARFSKKDFTYPIPSGYKAYELEPNKTLIQLGNGEVKYLLKGNPEIIGGTNVVSTMTSNTTPSGVASASSFLATYTDAWTAFDDNNGGGWSTPSGTTTGWLSYEFPSNKKIGQYSLIGAIASERNPRDWTFEGWDGSSWVVLDTQINITDINNTGWKNFVFSNNSFFKKYRINITSNNGDTSLLQIIGMKMIESPSPSIPPSWKTVSTSTPTKSQFETYGMDDLSVITPEQWSDLLTLDSDIKLLTYVPTGNVADTVEIVKEGKKLSVNATPLPQFIKSTSPIELHSDLQKITLEESITSKAKYLFSSDKVQWKTWNGTTFVNVNTSTNEDIYKNSLTVDQIHSLTAYDLSKWDSNLIYIGIYLEDDIRDKVKNEINKISAEGLLPLETSTVSDTKLYILNTTSTINVQLLGPKLVGTVNDEDSTRVQYKVKLNDVDYYPSDGSFTDLQRSPLSISLEIPSYDVLIDQENKLKIEFQDYWGMTDYWETTFIGTYNGLLFLDKDGDYYSTNIGEVLQNLDFGVLIAGQTSIEQEIILKNTHGYDVENIKIGVQYEFQNSGLEVQFSKSDIPFIPLKELVIEDQLLNDEQISFFIRLSTQRGMNPASIGFDIEVTADPVRI